MPHHRPLDAREIPRFAGVRTFMRAPHTTDLAGVDAAVYGIPFDTATTYRTGTRFGPEAIRSASALLRPYNPALEVNVVEALSIVDYGDFPVSPGDTQRTYGQIEKALAPLVDAGVFPLALGGDHSVTLAELRLLASRHGPLPARPRRRPLDRAPRPAVARLPARAAHARPARCARRYLGRVLRPAILPRHVLPAGGRGEAHRAGGVGAGWAPRLALRRRGSR